MRMSVLAEARRRSGVAYALSLDFKNAAYSVAGTSYSPLSTVPGYTYTRSGAKSELNGTASPVAFAANVPGIVPGLGYWSRAAVTNAALQSNAFDSATWPKNAWTATADTTVAPDGTTTADTITEDAASTAKYSTQSVTTTVAPWTVSVFAKAGTNDKIQLIGGFSGVEYCDFNLTSGTVGSSNACTGYIVNCGSGWYRCIVTGSMASTTSNIGFGLISATTDGRTPVYTGTSRTLSLWGYQAQAGNFPDGGPIIATTTAAASIGADALAVGVANGTYTATYTFDDLSTQVITGVVIAAGTFTLPVNPTTLTRGLVQKLVFV